MKVMAVIILFCVCVLFVGFLAFAVFIGGPQLLDQIVDARDEWREVIARFKEED